MKSLSFIPQLADVAIQIYLVRAGEEILTEVRDPSTQGAKNMSRRTFNVTDAVYEAARLLHAIPANGKLACEQAARELGTTSLWTVSEN